MGYGKRLGLDIGKFGKFCGVPISNYAKINGVEVVQPIELALASTSYSESVTTSYTFSAMSLGEIVPARCTLVAIASLRYTTGDNAITNVTVGGVTAPYLFRRYFTATSTKYMVSLYGVPSGIGTALENTASADVVVNHTYTQEDVAVAVLHMNNSDGVNRHGYSGMDVADSECGTTVDIPQNGVGIVVGMHGPSSWWNYQATLPEIQTLCTNVHPALSMCVGYRNDECGGAFLGLHSTNSSRAGCIAVSLLKTA